MRGRRLAAIGVAVTGLYGVFLVWIAWSDWPDFKELRPNEWGDFLAGGLGPLAIFWLVLSFFQQSKELQHSVDALRLQAEELKHSVEQQKELVGISKETLDYERALSARREQEARLKRQPDFVINGVGGKSGSGSVMNRVQMSNVGAPVSKVEFQVDPPLFSGSFGFSAYWPKGENKTFEVSFNKIGPMSEVTLNIHFVDEDGFVGTHTFLIWAEEGRPFSIQSRRKN